MHMYTFAQTLQIQGLTYNLELLSWQKLLVVGIYCLPKIDFSEFPLKQLMVGVNSAYFQPSWQIALLWLYVSWNFLLTLLFEYIQ